MTDIPSASEMSPEAKAIRKIELQQMNDLADRRLGRDTSPLFTEKNLSKATKEALASVEPIKPKEGTFYKETPEMTARQDSFDKFVKNRSDAPKFQHGPVSKLDRLLAWHKGIGSNQAVIDYEVAQLKAQEGKQ